MNPAEKLNTLHPEYSRACEGMLDGQIGAFLLPVGTELVRFSGTMNPLTGKTIPVEEIPMSAWWMRKSDYDSILKVCEQQMIAPSVGGVLPLGELARRALAVKMMWSEMNRIVFATVVDPLEAYLGSGKIMVDFRTVLVPQPGILQVYIPELSVRLTQPDGSKITVPGPSAAKLEFNKAKAIEGRFAPPPIARPTPLPPAIIPSYSEKGRTTIIVSLLMALLFLLGFGIWNRTSSKKQPTENTAQSETGSEQSSDSSPQTGMLTSKSWLVNAVAETHPNEKPTNANTGFYERLLRDLRIHALPNETNLNRYIRSTSTRPIAGGIVLGNTVSTDSIKIIKLDIQIDKGNPYLAIQAHMPVDIVTYRYDDFTSTELWCAYHVIHPTEEMKQKYSLRDGECNLVSAKGDIGIVSFALHPAIANTSVGAAAMWLDSIIQGNKSKWLSGESAKFNTSQWFDPEARIFVENGQIKVSAASNSASLLTARFWGKSKPYEWESLHLTEIEQKTVKQKLLMRVLRNALSNKLITTPYLDRDIENNPFISEVFFESGMGNLPGIYAGLQAKGIETHPAFQKIERFSRILSLLRYAKNHLSTPVLLPQEIAPKTLELLPRLLTWIDHPNENLSPKVDTSPRFLPPERPLESDQWWIVKQDNCKIGFARKCVKIVEEPDGSKSRLLYFAKQIENYRLGTAIDYNMAINLLYDDKGRIKHAERYVDSKAEGKKVCLIGEWKNGQFEFNVNSETKTLPPLKTDTILDVWDDNLQLNPLAKFEIREVIGVDLSQMTFGKQRIESLGLDTVSLLNETASLSKIIRNIEDKGQIVWMDKFGFIKRIDFLSKGKPNGIVFFASTMQEAMADNEILQLMHPIYCEFSDADTATELIVQVSTDCKDLDKILPESARQTIKEIAANTWELKLRAETPFNSSGVNWKAMANEVQIGSQFLLSSSRVQANDPNVVDMADQIQKNDNLWLTALKIQDLTLKTVKFDMSVRNDDAASAVVRKTGDCRSRSALMAAILRVHGIPSRLAHGYMHSTNVQYFVGHEWVEICIGKQWYSLESSGKRGGISAGVIKLSNANDDDTYSKEDTKYLFFRSAKFAPVSCYTEHNIPKEDWLPTPNISKSQEGNIVILAFNLGQSDVLKVTGGFDHQLADRLFGDRSKNWSLTPPTSVFNPEIDFFNQIWHLINFYQIRSERILSSEFNDSVAAAYALGLRLELIKRVATSYYFHDIDTIRWIAEPLQSLAKRAKIDEAILQPISTALSSEVKFTQREEGISFAKIVTHVSKRLFVPAPPESSESDRLIDVILGDDLQKASDATKQLVQLGSKADSSLGRLIQASIEPGTKAKALEAIETVLPEAFGAMRGWNWHDPESTNLNKMLAIPRMRAIFMGIFKTGLVEYAKRVKLNQMGLNDDDDLKSGLLRMPPNTITAILVNDALRGDHDAFDTLSQIIISSRRNDGSGELIRNHFFERPIIADIAKVQPKFRAQIAKLVVPDLKNIDFKSSMDAMEALGYCGEYSAPHLADLRKLRFQGSEKHQLKADEVIKKIEIEIEFSKPFAGKTFDDLVSNLALGSTSDRRRVRDRLIEMDFQSEPILLAMVQGGDFERALQRLVTPEILRECRTEGEFRAAFARARCLMAADLIAAKTVSPRILAIIQIAVGVHADQMDVDLSTAMPEEFIFMQWAKVLYKHAPSGARRDAVLDRFAKRQALWFMARVKQNSELMNDPLARLILLPGEKPPKNRLLSDEQLLEALITELASFDGTSLRAVNGMTRLLPSTRPMSVIEILPDDAPEFRKVIFSSLTSLQTQAAKSPSSTEYMSPSATLLFAYMAEMTRRPMLKSAAIDALTSIDTLRIVFWGDSRRMWHALLAAVLPIADEKILKRYEKFIEDSQPKVKSEIQTQNGSVDLARAVIIAKSTSEVVGVKRVSGKTYITEEFFTAPAPVSHWKIHCEEKLTGQPKSHTCFVRRPDGKGLVFYWDYANLSDKERYRIEYKFKDGHIWDTSGYFLNGSFYPPSGIRSVLEFRKGKSLSVALEDDNSCRGVIIEQIDTPFGKMKTLQVINSTDGFPHFDKTWYAPGFWIVRQERHEDSKGIISRKAMIQKQE